jgi:hypothetical protein
MLTERLVLPPAERLVLAMAIVPAEKLLPVPLPIVRTVVVVPPLEPPLPGWVMAFWLPQLAPPRATSSDSEPRTLSAVFMTFYSAMIVLGVLVCRQPLPIDSVLHPA